MLEEAGTNLQNIIKANVYLKNMEDFASMNKAYLEFFPDYVPVRNACHSLLRVQCRVVVLSSCVSLGSDLCCSGCVAARDGRGDGMHGAPLRQHLVLHLRM